MRTRSMGRPNSPLLLVNEALSTLKNLVERLVTLYESTMKFDFLTVSVTLLFKYSLWEWPSATALWPERRFYRAL